MAIPRLLANGRLFDGCLPTQGAVSWPIPVPAPSAEILVPVPDAARSVELVMRVDDPGQKVGAASVLSPSGERIYTAPCSTGPPCSPTDLLDQYFGNGLRHLPAAGQSVLLFPPGPRSALEVGAYRVDVSSFHPNDVPGSAIPRVTAVVRLDALAPGTVRSFDLHFFFLNLSDHPCAAMTNNARLDARAAASFRDFQAIYLAELRTIFYRGSLGRLTIRGVTLEDIVDRPELDGLDVANAGALLSLGKYADGINVFFVRSLSPIGVQAIGPNPGPAGVAGTRQSGIAIGLDTLCYRDWKALARLTAHEIARYMGLYRNVEMETPQHPSWRDPIDDNDDDIDHQNLMFFSERGGTNLSLEQVDVLRRSPVLR
jgi:hypothetical protein